MNISEREKMLEAGRRLAAMNTARRANSKAEMTPSGKKNIEEAISLLAPEDRYDIRKITAKICEINYEKFVHEDLNKEEDALGTFVNHMNRKKMPTTGAIMDQVALYLSTFKDGRLKQHN